MPAPSSLSFAGFAALCLLAGAARGAPPDFGVPAVRWERFLELAPLARLPERPPTPANDPTAACARELLFVRQFVPANASPLALVHVMPPAPDEHLRSLPPATPPEEELPVISLLLPEPPPPAAAAK